jgi:phage FluMu gp28-like protein
MQQSLKEVRDYSKKRKIKYTCNFNKIRTVSRKHPDITVSNDFITSIYGDKLPGKSPHAICIHQPTDKELIEWMADASNYIQLTNFNGKPLLLEDYQTNWASDSAPFRWCGKSRRVGLSFVVAAESFARAQLTNTSKDWTILSYTMEEAINKIEYARSMYDAMPSKFKRKKMRDRRQSLEFVDTVNGIKTRLVSHAQRAPRGGGGDVILDEFAHFQWANKILEAAIACTLTGQGGLTILSTPFGEGDPFHEIGTNLKKYAVFNRHYVYWWDCPWLCNDIYKARLVAEKMTTRQRVEKFGTDKLKRTFDSYIDIESFQQEMEIVFLSEAFKYFPRDLIVSCIYPWSSQRYVDKDGTVHEFKSEYFDEDMQGANIAEHGWLDYNGILQPSAYIIVRSYQNDNNIKFFKCNTIEELAALQVTGAVGPNLIAGLDIGRTKDPSCFSILEECRTENGTIVQIERYSEKWHGVTLPEQSSMVTHAMNILRSMKLGIDAQGIGRHMTENFEFMFPGRIFAKYFTLDEKSEMCKNFKMRMQNLTIALAEDRETIEHIHSIRQTISRTSRAETFSASEDSKHHADFFWSKAIASITGTPAQDSRSGLSFDTTHQFLGPRQYSMLLPTSSTLRRLVPSFGAQVGVSGGTTINSFRKNQSGIFMPEGAFGLPHPNEVL